MRLTEKAFEEFKRLYEEDCPDQPKTDAELRMDATDVMRAVELVYKPITKDNMWIFERLERGEGILEILSNNDI